MYHQENSITLHEKSEMEWGQLRNQKKKKEIAASKSHSIL